MASEDDEELREHERLRELGLLHLADKPEELMKELERRIAERERFEQEEEKKRRARGRTGGHSEN